MRKTLYLLSSLLSVQAASVCMEERALIYKFQEEMMRVCSYSVVKKHLIFEDVKFDSLRALQEQWCGMTPQGAHLAEALIKLGHVSDKKIVQRAKNTFYKWKEILFEKQGVRSGEEITLGYEALTDLESMLAP